MPGPENDALSRLLKLSDADYIKAKTSKTNAPNITQQGANAEDNIDFSNSASDFGQSQYDRSTPVDQLANSNYQYLRGERQSNWDKAGNGLVNMAGKTLTTATEGIINPFYGTIAAVTNGDFNSYYNNDLTKTLDKVNEAVDKNNPFYSDKKESTDQGLAKLWHANTIFRDILGGAGTSIGAALTGVAWSKGMSLIGKTLGSASTAEEAAILADKIKAGATEGLKDVANAATKQQIKDGARQGSIALMSATGEAGAEARETEKNIRYKLTHDMFGNEKQMTEGELAYVDMMAKQAGDMAFGMNLPVIMADNWLTFGKVMFGNKTNDFAKIANKTTVFDEATQAYKAVEKGKYANLAYRAGKIGTPMLSEGNQEILQFGIGKTAEDYYVNKYYNPNAADFLDSFSKGMAEAYTSQEGLHAGIIGALSAGITSPGIVLATQGKKGFKDEFISNPEDKITLDAVESLNKYKAEDLRNKFINNYIRQANLTEKKDDAIEANDDFNYHNTNDDMMFSYAYNRLQNGKLDETKQELNNFKDLTVEELRDNYGVDINVADKASVEAITGKGAVQKYVQERLDKLAKIEDTYNQVTKLFPNANPDVKELLIYSAQGLENTKQRKTEVAAKITKILQENSEAFTSIGFAEALLNKESKDHNMLMYSAMDPKSFAKAYNNLDTAGKKLFKKQITEADDISPIHQAEILKSLDDVEKLKAREIDFTLTYNALKDPKNQAIFLNASENLWGKFADIAQAKEEQDVVEENNKPIETPVENTPVETPVDTNTTPTEVITPVENTNTNPVDESNTVSNIPAANFGFTETTPTPEVKSTSDKHLVLNTPPEARDTQVLYTDKDGVEHLVGEYRSNENNELDSFEAVRQALEYFKSAKEPKTLVHFIEVNGFVMLQIANVNISTISKKGGSVEQKAISDLFYNPDGSVKSLEEINNLYQAGVIQLDLTKHLNTLLKDDVKPTLAEAYDMLVSTADTVKFKQGITDINLEGETEVKEYDPSIEEAKDQMSLLQSDIAEGLHIEVVVDGRVDVIKVKTKTNNNAQQSFDEVVNTITNSQGNSKVIKEAIDKFNNELFFALEPIKGVVRKFQLNYSVKTNTFYFTLQTKDKNTGSYSAPVQMKNSAGINILNNIHPSILSAEYVIDQLADSNVNKNVKFSAKNIRYSSFINEQGEVDLDKLEVYVDPNGLFKYGVQFSINAEAKPLVTDINSTIETPSVEVKTTKQTKPDYTVNATSFEDLLRQQEADTNEETEPDENFSIGLEESTGITQSEIDAVKTILPRFISIEDITTIANNLKVKGIPYGVFKNKVIYLNKTKGKPGTAYHEAFHAVFRTMLNDSQIEKYYNAASEEFKKSGKNMKQEIEKLRSTVASYTNKSEGELENLVLEEFMADKFMDYSMNKNQENTGNLLKQLFFKIKNFFKELFNIGEELDMFYDNILKGKFANSQEVNNTYFNITDSVFKLLPKKNNAQENGFFNASESRKIIGYFAIKIHKAKLSGQFKELTDEELLDKFIAERIQDLDTKGLAYGNSIFASNPEYAKELANKTASEKYLYDKNSINNAKIRPYDVLKSSVNDKLAIFKYKTAEEANEEAEGGEEATHMKDTFGSQDSFLSGGHDSLSQTIKKYVAFTTRIEKDEITNEDREVGIDEVALYNGLTSILADTSEERMIAKLYDASESNSNIKAFYDQLITDLGITFDSETRTTSYPTNPEASNITRALLTNFKNSKATQIDVLVGESWVKDAEGKNTKVKANTWVNANKNDAKKISLERWKTKVTYISRQKSIKEFQHNFTNVDKIFNNYIKGNISLDKAVQDIDKTGKKGIKEYLDENGITLTSIYIKISLAKQKALLNPDKLSAKDKNFISIYDTTEPIDFKMFGAGALNNGFSIIDVINKDLKALFDEKDGVLGRLGILAENNAKFDESIANFSFTNAEGKKVYEIIKPSYVLSRPELYKKDSYWESVEKGEGLTEVEKKNTYFLRDNYLVTKHKDLLKNLKINILSGFRDTTIGASGKSKDGVTFGSFDARTYLLSAITLYHNKGNKEVGKYMFRQNEASSTGYVAELPKIDISSVAGQQQVTDYFLTQVTKEWNRIKREKKAFDKKPGDLKGYNTNEKGRAFDFTEFQYLKDTMGAEAYKALVDSALDSSIKELTPEQITVVNKGVKSYLTASFEEFKKTVDKNQIRLFLTEDMKGEQSSYDSLLWEFYVNDYIMSNSLNELMDGDYALSRKDKVDISKRNKGAMASGPDFGRGTHTSAIIKDIDLYTSTVLINNKIVRVKPEFDTAGNLTSVTDESGKVLELTKDQIASYTSNDAMSYASQFHMMMGAFRLGRVDGATRQSYKDIIQFTKKDKDGNVVRNVNIGDKSQKALSEALASLNSKKTIVFDGINGQYLKMSELGFIRSAISYIDDKDVDKFTELTNKVFDLMTKDDYESNEFRNTIKELTKLYKPVAGMDYWHKLANNMDLHGIDHLAVESASKGATRSPQDSQATDLDLSKSKFNVSNANKRLQVETPTGKKEIVTGSQILTLIASELKDNEKVNGVTLGQLRKEYNEAIASTRNSSFKRAMSVIKKLSDGTIDKSELDEVVKRALAASGADEQLLEFFNSPLNYNMIQMIVKAEQVILSHFSKGVLSQKVNGDKVSLVTDAGINVVREISTGRVISHHEIVKNPSAYSDTTKYEQSKLRYNVEEGDLKYSECMLSQTVLTRHGLKIGDVITPEMTEVLKMLGYRIPTGDKQSAMSLKVVSLLPDYYNGIGIFPSEIVHLSGADFDIDSEFIQMPYFWYKKDAPTVPIKYGSEKSVKDAFEGFKFYNLNYDKDFSRDYKELLANNYKHRSLKKAVKQVQAEIDEVKGRIKQDLILGSQGLKGEMEIIENNIYMQVSTKYGLPFTEKDFIAKGKKPNAVLNNEALDRMISMLANNHTAEIANNTTSTDALKSLVSKMKSEGFIKESESKVNQKNKSASDINGKFDANSKNSAGKNGIGIAANKIQQFALLMSKVGDKIVKFNDEAFKFEIANETGGKYSAINKDNQRIADNLNILLNVFTDNAKDPIAGELNIQFELLGGFTELIMQGMSFENAVKFINLPIIQEYGKVQKALKSKVKTEIEESFNKNNAQAATIVSLENGGKINTKAIELVNKTAEKINPEQKEITLKQIENILLGKEFTKEELGDANDGDTMSVQYQALAQFIKVQEQYNVMATLNTFLTLNQGLDTSFTELNFKLHKAIDTWGLNDELNTQDRGLSVGEAHIDIKPILKDDANTLGNIQKALEVSKEVGQKIFIEQTELFNKEFNKLLDNLQDKFSNVADNVSDVSREFLGYVSVKAYLDELESLKNEVGTKEVNKQAIQKRLDSLNLGLIFNDLAGSNGNLVSQLELLKSNPAAKDNYIIKYFTIKENIIDTKSFVKESNETISLLIDSVKSLYFDNKTQLNDSGLTPRDFVDNMLSYLMVKDNMQFKNNSVAKYLPVNMFSKYSNTLDDLVKGLVTKNTSMNFAEVGYNFRKMYVTDVNTSYGAMQTIKLDPKDNTPVRLNGENLEFVIDTTSEDGLKESSATLSKIFSKLDVKTKVKTWPAFKFPQFIKVRIGNDQYKVYELDSFTNNAKGFTDKKDNFLNYIDASQGVKHNLENAYAAGEKATYKPLDQIGVKDVSVFFPGTYDKAKVLFDQVKPEEVDIIPSVTKPGKFTSIEDMGKPTTPIEQSTSVNPYAMTSELANDVSTEVNASEVKLPEEKPLKVEEKDVTLDAKKNLLAMVNSQELFIEGKEFTEAQYQKLKDRINAAKTMNELMALEENITKCM